jgi:hypothetical protein
MAFSHVVSIATDHIFTRLMAMHWAIEIALIGANWPG